MLQREYKKIPRTGFLLYSHTLVLPYCYHRFATQRVHFGTRIAAGLAAQGHRIKIFRKKGATTSWYPTVFRRHFEKLKWTKDEAKKNYKQDRKCRCAQNDGEQRRIARVLLGTCGNLHAACASSSSTHPNSTRTIERSKNIYETHRKKTKRKKLKRDEFL